MRVLNKYKTKDKGRYIGRGSPFGNPFIIGTHGSRIEVVYMFEQYLKYQILIGDPAIIKELQSLKADDDLLCSCAPKLCHGSVIARFYEELASGGLNEFRNEYNLYGEGTNGVDHINLATPGNTMLSRNLYELILLSKGKCKDSIQDEDYFIKLREAMFYFAEGHESLIDMLSKNSMPFYCYKPNSKTTPHGIILDCWFHYAMIDLTIKLTGKKRLIITSNKNLCDYEIVRTTYLESGIKAGVIISGLNEGVDRHTERLATEFKIPLVRCYPYWNVLSEKVDTNRDKDMLEYSTAMIAIWDNKDKLVKEMINKASTQDKALFVKTVC